RHSGEPVFPVHHLFQVLERFLYQARHRIEVPAQVGFGNGKKVLFGRVQQFENVARLLVGVIDDLGGNADEPALDVLLGNDPRVVFDIGGGSDPVGELGDVKGPPRELQLPALAELLGNG